MSIIEKDHWETDDRPAGGSFYVTGGTLPFSAASYIPRQADHDLLAGLSGGEFCYVLNTRQMGKSSLMIRTANHLRLQGSIVAVLDLTAVGQNLSPAQWYNGLLMSLAEQLHLDDPLEDFWKENPNLGPFQRFMTALGKVVLPQISQRLMLFVDEIDAVRSLPFPADEFFAGIRECYNRRQTDPAYAKLTFCLLGVATPADLIVDTRMSPFNIGRRILLTDFTPAEAAPLAQGLAGGTPVLNRVLYWTNGHPYMTQRLCRAIAEEPDVVTPSAVDAICERLFLTKQARDTDDNLAFVRNRLLRSEVDLAALLDLYQQVRAGRRVKDDETNPLVPILRLSGVVSVRDGLLRVRNRTYDRVFDKEWVSAHMPDAEKRRQAAAYRRGVLRTAALASVVVLLMALLSGWALHANHATQNALKAEKAAEQLATSEKQEAVAQKKAAQNLLRVADLQFAGQTFDSETGTAALANSLLDASRTGQYGHPETERFEWRYQWGIAHDSAAIVQSHATGAFPGALVAVTPDGVLTALDAGFRLHRVRLGRGQAFWQQPAARSAVSSQVLQAKPNDEIAYDLSPDGTLVAFGTSDGRIVVRDTADLRQVAAWGQGKTKGLTSLNFLQHNRLIRGCFGNGDQSVTDWDAHTGQTLSHWTKGQFPPPSLYNGARVWSPDGRYAVILINDYQPAQIQIIDMTRIGVEGYVPVQFQQGRQVYLTTAFSPDGKTLACGDYSGQVVLLDTVSRRRKQTLQALGKGTEIDALAFSADGNTLAVGGQDGLIRLWSLQPGSAVLLGAFKGHTDGIAQLQFSLDGKWLASSDSGGTARAWNLGRLRDPLLYTGDNHFVDGLAFSPDGQWLASSADTGKAHLWDLQTWQEQPLPKCLHDGAFRGGTQRISAFAFSPDGRTVATSGEVASDPAPATKTRKTRSGSTTLFIQFWDRKTEQAGPRWETVQEPSQMSGGLHVLAFSPDGRTLVGGFGQVYEVPQQEPHGERLAALWDVATGHLRRTLTGFREGVTALSYAPDGRSLAVGCMDQTVRCFDTRTWALARTFAAQDYVTSVAYSPDGSTLAVGEWSGLIRLTNTRTWAVQSLIGHSDTLRDLSFSTDSLTLASASEDGTVKLWDAVTGRETRTLSVGGQKLYRVAFSPTGNLLAAGDGEDNIHLWYAAPAVGIAAWEQQKGVDQNLHGTSTAVTGAAAKSGWLTAEPETEPSPFLRQSP